MWDLDELLSVSDLQEGVDGINLFLSVYKEHLSSIADNIRCVLFKEPVTITTTLDIYNNKGLYSISFKFDDVGEIESVSLTGNTDMFEDYGIHYYFRKYRFGNKSGVETVPVFYNILEKGSKTSILDISLLYYLLHHSRIFYNDGLDVSNLYYDLLNYETDISCSDISSFYELLEKNNISIKKPTIRFSLSYLKEPVFSKILMKLYSLSLKYDFNLYLALTHYSNNEFESSLMTLFSFCSYKKIKDLKLRDEFWLYCGVSDGEKLYISNEYLGYRENDSLILEYTDTAFKCFLNEMGEEV